MQLSPILSQISKAQDAYERSVANWSEVDTKDVLLAANQTIEESIKLGRMATIVPNIADVMVAEKAAIELQGLGYNTGVVGTGQAALPDNAGFRQLFGVTINWKFMPANTRDGFTV